MTLTAPVLPAPGTPATGTPTLDLERLAPGFGARVHGVDLASATDAQVRAISTALSDHKVLFFS